MKLKKLLGYLLVTSLATSMLFSTTVMASSNTEGTDETKFEAQSSNSSVQTGKAGVWEAVGDSSWDAKDLGPISDEERAWYIDNGEATAAEVENFHNYSITVQFDRDAAHKEAELLNNFRTSDTWYRDDGSKGQMSAGGEMYNPTTGKYTETSEHSRSGKTEGIIEVSGLNALEYDYGLEQVAMERARNCLFRLGHINPDSTVASMVYYKYTNKSRGYGSENIHIGKMYEITNAQDSLEKEFCNFKDQAHRRNMLREGFTHVGIGVVHYGDLTAVVQVFANGATGITEDQGYDGVQTQTVVVDTSAVRNYDGLCPADTFVKIPTIANCTERTENIIEEPTEAVDIQPEVSYRDPKDLGHTSLEEYADDENMHDFSIKVEYDRKAARRGAELLNKFRTSDTWYYSEPEESANPYEKTDKVAVSGLEPLEYDYGLEKIAMERAAEILFCNSHGRPDGKTDFSALYHKYTELTGGFGENFYYSSGSWDEDFDVVVEAQTGLEEEERPYKGQGHRRNMLVKSARYVGIGVLRYGDKSILVQQFSSRPTGIKKDQGYNGLKTQIVTADTSYINNIPKWGCIYYKGKEITETGDEYQNRQQEYDYYEYSPDFFSESYLDGIVNEVNKFRTSDTWIYDTFGKNTVTGLKALKKDNGLEEIAKQRIAEMAFHYSMSRLKPDGSLYYDVFNKMENAGIYDDIYISECESRYDISDKNNHVSAKTVVDGWIQENASDYIGQRDRRSMLDEELKYIGSASAFVEGHQLNVIVMSKKPTGREEASDTNTFTVEVTKGVAVDDYKYWDNRQIVIPSGAKLVEAPRDPNWDIPKGCKLVADDPYDQDNSDNPSNPGNSDNPNNPDGSGVSGNNESTSLKLNYKSKTDISSLIQGTGVKVKYSSSNKKVAKINNKGIATGGKQAGTATITKYIKETKKSPWTEAGSITVTNYNPTLPKKETLTIGNTINLNEKLTGTEEVPVSWESSNPGAVTVTADGIATAVGKGSAKISPVFSTGKSKAKIKIKVPKN